MGLLRWSYYRWIAPWDAKSKAWRYRDDLVEGHERVAAAMEGAALNAERYYAASNRIAAANQNIKLYRQAHVAYVDEGAKALERNLPKLREKFAKSMDKRAIALSKELIQCADKSSTSASQPVPELSQFPRQPSVRRDPPKQLTGGSSSQGSAVPSASTGTG